MGLFDKTKGTYCGYCERRKLARWQPPNLAVHSLLVVATCGLWFPVFLAVVLFGGGWVCTECGSRTR